MLSLRTQARVEKAQQDYHAAREAAIAQFSQRGRVESLWRALSKAADSLLGHALGKKPFALVAVGGYGRRELFPFSDIDVMLLLPEGADASAAEAIIRQLYALCPGISHATRTVTEALAAAEGEHTIAASLLSARFVAGERRLFRAFEQRFTREVLGRERLAFVAAKLSEREARHSKWGDSRFMLEPHIKEGKGALRDLQTLEWISHYCFGTPHAAALLTAVEWKQFRALYHFLATVRAHMHVLRGRAEERLTFDLHTELAARMKFPGRTPQQKAESMMRRYFDVARETGALTRIFCAALDAEKLRALPAVAALPAPPPLAEGFTLVDGRLTFDAPEKLAAQPARSVTLFAEAAAHYLALHPAAYVALARALPTLTRALRFEGAAQQEFLRRILCGSEPELHLRRMNEAGVLGALIPEFEHARGMMQYDGYHTYTVDEHSLVAIGNFTALAAGSWEEAMPIASRVVREITDPTPLLVALLCHDLAKGTGGNHSEKGGAVVVAVGTRMGLTAAQLTLARWLVESQELLSETAFKRDLDDPATLADFITRVQSPERLRLLLLLTVCDVKAVGPTIWNGWKGALLRDLFTRAMAAMGVASTLGAATEDATREVYTRWQQAPTQAALAITHDRFRAISEIACATAATPTALRDLAGVLAYLGASIVSARVRVSDDGAALLVVGIQDITGNSFAEEAHRLARLPALLIEAARGALNLTRELPKRRRLPRGQRVGITPAVFIDNHISAEATVVEVNARDRIGLLYDILGGFEACQLRVISAQLATYGDKAVDVFYVRDTYGHKLTHSSKREALTRALLAVCAEDRQAGAA